MLLQISWNPSQNLFAIGDFSVRYYSLCWIVGLVLAYLVVQRLYRQQGLGEAQFEPLPYYCFFGILIGARLGHCLFYEPAFYLSHPVEMLLPIRSTAAGWKFVGYQGLASHGGTLGLMLALWLYVKKTKVDLWQVLDNIAIATPITACMIRLGNLMNSEIVGKATDLPWGFVFVQNGEDFARHPAQLYEALAYLLIFVVGWWIYKRYPKRVGTGWFFGYCLATIFTFRFFIEFCKEVQVGFEQNMALDMGQWLSIPFIIMGVLGMMGKLKRKKL